MTISNNLIELPLNLDSNAYNKLARDNRDRKRINRTREEVLEAKKQHDWVLEHGPFTHEARKSAVWGLLRSGISVDVNTRKSDLIDHEDIIKIADILNRLPEEILDLFLED